MTSDPVLQVDGLAVEFQLRRRTIRVVSDVSFSVPAGQTQGLVGESGSGKTTICRAILGLAPITSGTVRVAGRDVSRQSARERRRHAGELGVVFQDPNSSLNPALTVRASLLEGFRARGVGRSDAEARMVQLLKHVGVPESMADRYPVSLSGGQRQRLAIARALMSSPRLVICDEPVSALDVSVQAQVLNLLRASQAESSLSYLFIGHDLHVVRYMSDRIAVLYHGRIVEAGPAEVVVHRPRHPYTQALVAASPDPRAKHPTAPLAGAVGARRAIPVDGCGFAPRCGLATDLCWYDRPPLETAADGSQVACHHADAATATGLAEWPASPSLVHPEGGAGLAGANRHINKSDSG